MADDRLILVHVGLGVGIVIGKRLGVGWYSAPPEHCLQEFYDYCAATELHPGESSLIVLIEESSKRVSYGGIVKKLDGCTANPIREIFWVD